MRPDELVEPKELPYSEQRKILAEWTDKEEKGEASKKSHKKNARPVSPLDENLEEDSSEEKLVNNDDEDEYVIVWPELARL